MADPHTSGTTIRDDPPAEPIGESVSTGELVGGRWMGTGGLLGPRASEHSEPDRSSAPIPPEGPIVLMAVDGASMSDSVVRTAHRLFGEHATYLALNVGPGPYTYLSWAYVWPVGGSATWVVPPPSYDDGADDEIDDAMRRAGEITEQAGLVQATPIGDVGDPTSAIIRAAHHHHADVVVIGADDRGWMSHLLTRSVEHELLRDADFAVLVAAKDPGA